MIVGDVRLLNFRSYASLELGLEPGLVLAVGPNGAGKTNLLEALHVATQGFSPRTRADVQLVRFDQEAARVAVSGRNGPSPVEVELVMRPREGKRVTLNGAPLRSAEELRGRLSTLVFTPERLAIVKGAPSVRRAYFDRVLGRLLPAHAQLPAEYAAALGHRNAGLRRISLGVSTREAVMPWTERAAELGAHLVAARREAVGLLQATFCRRGEELGVADAALAYEGEALSVEELDAALERDLRRGWTTAGAHAHDFALRSGDRDLRVYGSQGEQRLAVLALLLAEAEMLAARRPAPPLLLLDDVLSELDPARREILTTMLDPVGQTLITATSAEALPVAPTQLLEVSPGRVRVAA